MRNTVLADFGIPAEVLGHIGFSRQFDTRDTERALAGSGIEVPELDEYADKLWDYWERNLDPDLFKDRSFEKAVNGRTVDHHGRLERDRPGRRAQDRRGGRHPAAGGALDREARGGASEIEAEGGTAYVYSADLSDMDSIERLVAEILAEHPAVDMLVNNAGRSIRRSIGNSDDRFHDFERTMQLNYFGAMKLIIALLPQMRERGTGHIINVSSIGAQTTRRASAPTSPRRADHRPRQGG